MGLPTSIQPDMGSVVPGVGFLSASGGVALAFWNS
jgi:hypothetical protein